MRGVTTCSNMTAAPREVINDAVDSNEPEGEGGGIERVREAEAAPNAGAVVLLR
jgi:hypothetical protein